VASRRKRKQLPAAVGQRVGRLLGKNSRAAGAFEVKIDADVDGFAKCGWKKMDRWREWARLREGCYALRSNVTDWSAEDLWRAYMQLTEAEAAFHIQKTDLQLRPIWHQKKERVQAHILVCFLAFVLWKTLTELARVGLNETEAKGSGNCISTCQDADGRRASSGCNWRNAWIRKDARGCRKRPHPEIRGVWRRSKRNDGRGSNGDARWIAVHGTPRRNFHASHRRRGLVLFIRECPRSSYASWLFFGRLCLNRPR
jgi:hypothetical protein